MRRAASSSRIRARRGHTTADNSPQPCDRIEFATSTRSAMPRAGAPARITTIPAQIINFGCITIGPYWEIRSPGQAAEKGTSNFPSAGGKFLMSALGRQRPFRILAAQGPLSATSGRPDGSSHREIMTTLGLPIKQGFSGEFHRVRHHRKP